MNKTFIMIALSGVFLFACGNKNERNNRSHADSLNTEGNIEQHSGEEISPQVKTNPDSPTRLNVDTVSSAESAKKDSQ
jgi:hypothetical protein